VCVLHSKVLHSKVLHSKALHSKVLHSKALHSKVALRHMRCARMDVYRPPLTAGIRTSCRHVYIQAPVLCMP